MKIEAILNDIGLNSNESKLFLAAVKSGLASISRIASEAGIPRTYAYELAEELKKKGLFTETVEEPGIKKIQALDHEGLLTYIVRKQKDMERLQKDLIKSSSEFHALRKGLAQKTKVRFFEGVEGIKNIIAESRRDLEKLKRPHQFYVVFSTDGMEAVLPGWVEHNQHIYFEPYMQKFAIISKTPLLEKFLEKVKQNSNT